MILAYSSTQKETRSRIQSQVINETKKEWSVSADLVKGEKIVVEIRVGSDWSQSPLESDPSSGIGMLYAFMDIQDPVNNLTKFDLTFARSETTGSLTFWNISVTQQGGLNTTALYNEQTGTYDGIGGICEYDGTYKVIVTDTWPTKQSPPAYLAIVTGKIVTVTEQPYAAFLPGGIVIGAMGAVSSLFAFRKPKRKNLSKRKTQHLSPSKSLRQR